LVADRFPHFDGCSDVLAPFGDAASLPSLNALMCFTVVFPGAGAILDLKQYLGGCSDSLDPFGVVSLSSLNASKCFRLRLHHRLQAAPKFAVPVHPGATSPMLI
jgi:hypothetical protein